MTTQRLDDAVRNLELAKQRVALLDDVVFVGVLEELERHVDESKKQLCRNRHDDYQQGLKQGGVRLFEELMKLVGLDALKTAQKAVDDIRAKIARENGEDIE